jgi:hypothetical protein
LVISDGDRFLVKEKVGRGKEGVKKRERRKGGKRTLVQPTKMLLNVLLR